VDQTIILFTIVGFVAQLIDGALGMAYGVSSTTFLLSIGIPPAAASAGVLTAEILVSGISGLSHLKFGNVDKKLFKNLSIPGIIGGIIGTYILAAVPGKNIKPFAGFYLLMMGLMILRKAFRKIQEEKVEIKLFPMAAFGGFFDAIGGGSWSPVVTSTLVARGNDPRFAIGSVNLSEFFVTIAEAAAFFTLIELVQWRIVIGLIIGGILAAPVAAYACKNLPSKALKIILRALIVVLGVRTIYLALL